MTRPRFLAFLLIWLTLSGTSLGSQPKLVIVLRVDDVLSRNTTILPRSIVPFEQAAEQRGAKVTWVTIPHRLIESTNANGNLTRELRASFLKGHEISQHGYNHICTRCGSSNHEFYCVTQSSPFSLASQHTMIDDGLKILSDSLGIRPTSFVAPGHNEDTTTYRALVDRGFTIISTIKSPTKQEATPGLFNLAHHAEYTWALTASNYRSSLDTALSHVRDRGEKDGYFAFLFHDYFIRSGYESGIVVRWLGEVLDSLVARYGDQVEFLTLSEAASRFQGGATQVAQQQELPMRAELLNNYPNPFNPNTVIRFQVSGVSGQVSGVSMVDLRIYDLLGREVAVLVNEEKPAGRYSVTWDARLRPLNSDGSSSGMASGIYFYQLRAGGSVFTKSMVLLR